MRRGVLLAAGLAALLAAGSGRAGAPRFREPARPLAVALGPLRPVVAELLFVSFLEGWLHKDLFGQVDLAAQILSLRPDVPALRADLCYHFLLDVPGEAWEPEAAREWVKAGVRLLQDGLLRFPGSAELLLVRGNTIEVFARTHPDRLDLLGIHSGREALPVLLSCYEAALGASAPGSSTRDFARLRLSLVVEALLRDSDLPPELLLRARQDAHRLLALPETTVETRTRLEALLGE